MLHVVFGDNFGMNVVFNSVIFRGESERVPSHGIKDVITLHSSFSRHNIKRRIGPWMAYMQSLSRRIGKFNQCVIFWFGVVFRGLKRLFIVPDFLPFCLHFSVIIWYCHFSLISAPDSAHVFFPQAGFYRRRTYRAFAFCTASIPDFTYITAKSQ